MITTVMLGEKYKWCGLNEARLVLYYPLAKGILFKMCIFFPKMQTASNLLLSLAERVLVSVIIQTTVKMQGPI